MFKKLFGLYKKEEKEEIVEEQAKEAAIENGDSSQTTEENEIIKADVNIEDRSNATIYKM